jgi:voltage-gated potassium channel Kch
MRQITFADRLRYAFDRSMARGPLALIGWLGAISGVIVFLGAVLVAIVGIVGEGADGQPEEVGFAEALWRSLMHSLDAGTVAGDNGWSYRLLMLLITLGGIFIVSTLIGILSNSLAEKLEELRKGRSFVVEENHTLIIGWSANIFTIINELAMAGANQKKPRVVVLADKDKVEMEDEIRAKAGDLGALRVICRSGSPLDAADLDIVNPQAAKSIIILAPEEANDPDAQVIKTVLALTNSPNRRAEPYHIVAEIRDRKNLDVAQLVGRDEAQFILSGDLLSRLTVQTCRQSGLSLVYLELLDFGGDDIYFHNEPQLAGKTFSEALFAYEDSCVIGLRTADGLVVLRPPLDTQLDPRDQIIAISADDDTVRLSDKPAPALDERVMRRPSAPPAPKVERTLILGWNKRGAAIIRELDNYVPPGSQVFVVASDAAAADALREVAGGVRHLEVFYEPGETADRAVLDGLQIPSYDHVILLCYADIMPAPEADAHALMTLLHLRDIEDRSGQQIPIVSEMLDSRNRDLAEAARADDFIVSDRLTSLMLAQVSENKELMAVFADLFDASGSELYLKPATDYVAPATPVSFYTVLEAARQRGEIAVGYRLLKYANEAAQNYGVVVNPQKSYNVTFGAEDKIIVLADS